VRVVQGGRKGTGVYKSLPGWCQCRDYIRCYPRLLLAEKGALNEAMRVSNFSKRLSKADYKRLLMSKTNSDDVVYRCGQPFPAQIAGVPSDKAFEMLDVNRLSRFLQGCGNVFGNGYRSRLSKAEIRGGRRSEDHLCPDELVLKHICRFDIRPRHGR